MREIRCPNCREPLPWIADYCTFCGQALPSPSLLSKAIESSALESESTQDRQRPLPLKTPDLYTMAADEKADTRRAGKLHLSATINSQMQKPVSKRSTVPLLTDIPEDDIHDYEPESRATWSKVVTNKTGHIPQTPAPQTSIPPLTPHSTMGRLPRKAPERRTPPSLIFWISTLTLICLLLGGIFGIVITLGHGTGHSAQKGVMSLQITPSSVALGGLITLRGSNFTPNAQIGLTRDTSIPVFDTGNLSIIRANSQGSFSDTVIVPPEWQSGLHTIHAEDAVLHKSASFTVIVIGQSASLRPPHLALSTRAIDLGSGDQATNSTQLITLLNAGGGQISWQTTTTQPWLLVNPQNGTFWSEQNQVITVAGDRSNLKVGSYTANLLITSTAGQVTLPIKMSVTPLQAGHKAVLQLTPSVLSFTAPDGGPNPAGQVITVSNPGLLPLHWGALTSTSDGSSWLRAYPQAGTVVKGGSQPVTISVNTSTLLPGVYSGWVTFSNQGALPIQHSPQTIYVNLTITPQCAIQASPGYLVFSSAYLQPAPPPQTVNIGVTSGCSSALGWNASATTFNGGHWLNISPASGATPSFPSVSINVNGLTPGTYTGSVLFSSSAGTQTLPVSFTMGQPAAPVISNVSMTITFNSVLGQSNPIPQTITLNNSGGSPLTWQAAATTAVGGPWLNVTPAAGTVQAGQATPITITTKLLATLIPGTYNGTIILTGTDSQGHPAPGSPQIIPVVFVVQAACAIAVTPPALTFEGVIGQSNPAPQAATITASGACANPLTWTATAATTPAGGNWLIAASATGTVSLTTSASTNVGIALTGLTAGNYSGTITITAIDSVTKQAVGTPQVIAVKLTVQPPCTLQAPSVTTQRFSTEAGQNPAAQTFTIGVIGACSDNIAITPTATTGSGGNWLMVTPASATITSGGTVTFTVTVTAAGLSVGKYSGSISLAAVNGGIAITGSPQIISVKLRVLAPPALTASSAPLTFNVATGTSTQTITIGNTGGEPLNWTASLPPGAPSFVSLAPASGTLLAGASTTTAVTVDATGQPGGTTVTTTVTITAIDPITGLILAGSPVTITVTINIPPPVMQLSSTTLTFTTTTGSNPASQTINITNTGGDALNWTAGTPSQPWLTASPTSGSDTASQSSVVTFNVNVAGMSQGTYTATVDFTPAGGGTAQTMTATLTISGSAGSNQNSGNSTNDPGGPNSQFPTNPSNPAQQQPVINPTRPSTPSSHTHRSRHHRHS